MFLGYNQYWLSVFLWFLCPGAPEWCRQFIAKAYTCYTHSHCIKYLLKKKVILISAGCRVGNKTPSYRSEPASPGFAFAVYSEASDEMLFNNTCMLPRCSHMQLGTISMGLKHHCNLISLYACHPGCLGSLCSSI